VLTACRPDIRTAKRTVAPAAEPLDADDARRHLRVTDEDVDVAAYIAAARARVEGVTERALITQTWTVKLDGFWGSADLELPYPPLASVTSIVYWTDESGSTSTVAATVYEVDTASEPGRVRLKPGQSWPSDLYVKVGCITITFTSGYGATYASVPASFQQAMRLLLGHYDQNREGVVTGTIATALPEAVESLLQQERVPWD
jgi:uncharacterized phiE125 gp8 family phage protein